MTRSSRAEVGGSFFYIHPVDNLTLSGKTKRFIVGDCTIATRRSMMQCVRSSANWCDPPRGWGSAFDSDTFVAFACKGKPSQVIPQAEHRCREALWVLAGTMLYFSPRNSVRQFGLRGDIGTVTSEAALVGRNRKVFQQNWRHRGSLIPEDLECGWWNYYKQRRLGKFLTFTSDKAVTSRWKKTLWRAATLVGKSRQADSRAEAFLYQMFALEALMLIKGDPKRTTLAKRLCGLLFDHADSGQVEWLYGIRSEIVHNGAYDAVTPEALHLADYYAVNALWNAVVQRRHWSNKQEFLSFCSRRAESGRPPSSKLGLRVTWKPFNREQYELRLP